MDENETPETQEEADALFEAEQKEFDSLFEKFIKDAPDCCDISGDQLNALCCKASPSLRYFVQIVCDALDAWDAQDIIEEEMMIRGWERSEE